MYCIHIHSLLCLWGDNCAALKPLLVVSQNFVRGWLTYGGTGFSAVQFASAAVSLLDAKHHTVTCLEMQLLLGRLSARGINDTEYNAELSGPAVLESK